MKVKNVVLLLLALGLLTGCGQAASAGHDSSGAPVAEAQPTYPAAEVMDAAAPGPSDEDVVRVYLPVEPRTLQVSPDLAVTVWPYAGQVPGPVIRVKEGATVEVTVENKDTITHSIDFHAARVAPNVAFGPVAPGEKKTIRFEAKDPGVYMYHCGTAPMTMHIAMGMYGMIIVDPAEGRSPATEFALVQSEFYPDMDMAAMMKGDAAAVVFNGVANQYVDRPLKVKVGEPVRLYVVNAGPNHFSAFHVVGTIFDRVEPDGQPRNVQYGVSTYTLAPGGAAVFETHFDEPGRYPFLTHSMADGENGALGIIEVTP